MTREDQEYFRTQERAGRHAVHGYTSKQVMRDQRTKLTQALVSAVRRAPMLLALDILESLTPTTDDLELLWHSVPSSRVGPHVTDVLVTCRSTCY
eukprot:SAG11_NODE_2253_length_3630_cov_9.405551_1_plen_95_part_00